MKLSGTNRVIVAGSATLVSLCAGFLVTSSFKDFGKVLSLATLLSLPTIVGVHLVTDSKASRRINEAQKRASLAEDRARQSQINASEATLALNQRYSQLQELARKNKELTGELAQLRQALETTEANQTQLSSIVQSLKPTITQLQQQLATSQERIEQLEAECEEWESQFHQRVEAEADTRFKQARNEELERIFHEHDAITSQAMGLFRRLQSWAEKVAVSHEQKRELITTLATSYNQNLDELGQSVETERGHYIQQIELLNEKVGRLQHQLAGDLVEPEYAQFGFDPNGKIANALAEWLWHHRKIALKVTGFEISSDGVVTAGYTYSRSMPVEALSKVIEQDSPVIARNLGLYSVEKPTKLQIAEVLTVKIRRERPPRRADKGSLYRSSEELVKYILTQPVRLRIVGDPGAGKTPTVAVLLSHILKRGFLEANTPNGRKLPYTVVESCNPLAGISVKNGDELDFCLKWNSGARGFKGLVEEYRFRKNPANAEYKNQVGYIWVADEIDNSMAELTKDEAKPFKDSLKDGGHVNLGVIVMGQSANISTSKGLSIDDQKMMTNIYIDPVSIRTFLTQYGERFYSKRAVEKALSTLEELELESEEKNEVICDTAREFRIAMVTASRSPVFYQLPYFDSVEIDTQAYLEMLEKVEDIRHGHKRRSASPSVTAVLQDAYAVTVVEKTDTSGHSPMSGLGTRPDTPLKPVCPHCGSSNIRSKGDKWLCQNPEHSNQAPDKPKSWKK